MKTLRVVCLFFERQNFLGSTSGSAGSEASGGAIGFLDVLRLAEACLRWTPQVAVSNDAVFLEIGRCQSLYREDWLALKLQVLARRFNSSFRVAFAEDAPTALALARWGGVRENLPIEALSSYYNPFGTDPENLSIVREMIITLRKLGVERLSDFRALSARSLPSRFGKMGLLLHQKMQAAATIPWPRFIPPERILEKTHFEMSQPFHDLEPLFFSLKPVMDRAMARLRGKGERASGVRIRLHLERYSNLSEEERHRTWKFNLVLPQGSVLGMLPILRERMGFDLSQKPLPAPVTDLEFEIFETAPGVGSQRDFFDAREEEVEAWNSLIARLAEKLGASSVFMASPVERYLPENSWEKKSELSVETVSSLKQEAITNPSASINLTSLPNRPLRVLQTPLPLLKEGAQLTAFQSSRTWKVVGAEVPEILSGEWWFSHLQRNYFRVRTESGERLWVFQTPGSETLYLHGYFD